MPSTRPVRTFGFGRWLFCAGWVALGLSWNTRAAAQNDSLTLGQLYGLIDRGTPRVRAADAAARAARSRIAPAGQLPDPQLQLGLMNRSLPGLGLDPVLGMTQIQLMQMVPIAGQLGLSVRVATAQADAVAARAVAIRWDERVRAATAFYELYRIDHDIAIARTTQTLVRNIAATTASMYAVGEGRQADVLRAQVELARMSEDLIRMESMRSATAARLNAVLDRQPDEPIAPPALPRFPELPPADSLVRLALEARPMLEAGAAEVRAAEWGERRARREIWPDLQAGVQYGWRSMDGGTDHMLSLMVGFSVPLRAGSRQLAMRRESQAMREMAEADLAGMQAETRARITELLAEIGRAQTLLRLYRGTVLPQSQAMVTSSQSAYRTGAVDFMTLLDAQMSVNRYQQEVVGLEAELGIGMAELEMVTGTVLITEPALASTSGGLK
jgi:outer membrane protein TolC